MSRTVRGGGWKMLTAFYVCLKHTLHADFYTPLPTLTYQDSRGYGYEFIFALCPEWLETYLLYNFFICLFSWRYNPLWLYFHSPVAGFSLLVFEFS
jgi:hypothetical protein